MDLEPLELINMDMNWNIIRKSRTSITRRPRKPGTDAFGLCFKPGTKKFGADKLVDAPLKKRKLLRESTSPAPQTACLDGEGGLTSGPQTPAVHHEDSAQRCCSNSLTPAKKTKSKTAARNNKILKPRKKQAKSMIDFSGIELLADAACNSLFDDNANHVKDLSLLKEHVTPRANSCDDVDIKEAIVSTDSDNGNDRKDKSVAPSKELRLHWDLNTVMDEWVEPCDDLVAEPDRHDSCVGGVKFKLEGCKNRCAEAVGVEERKLLDSVCRNQSFVKRDVDSLAVPLVKNCNGNLSCSQGVMGVKTISGKTSYVESSASKSDVIDSLPHPVKCEDLTASMTSILREQTVVKIESNIKIEKSDQQPTTLEDPVVSECCGSNVTQEEQGHMAEGDSDGKVEVGYDSPFEDGELREPIGWEDSQVEEKETVDCASDNVNKADSGTMENPSSERVDHGQTKEIQSSLLVKEATPNNDTEQGAQADIYEKIHIDEPAKVFSERKDGQEELRSFDVCRNGAYAPQSRSNRFGDSYSTGRDNVSFRHRSCDDVSRPRGNSVTRLWDEKSNGSLDSRNNHHKNYNPYRSQYRRSSPSERNNGYGNRGPPARRSHSRDRDHDRYIDRYRQEYPDPKPSYLERNQRSTNFNRPKDRSRSRSRSGSPIAWNFQKRKNLDTSNSGEIETIAKGDHASPERSSKCFDDRRNRDGQSRDSRLIQRNQRFESIGYPERIRSDDHFRLTQRPTTFSNKYKDTGDAIRKHDDHYEKVNRVGRFDDNVGMRRFRYAVDDNRRNLDSYSRDAGNEHTTVIPESKS